MPEDRERPPRDFDMGGSCRTGKVRLRPGLFGWLVVDEQIEYRDGTVKWKRRPSWRGPITIDGKDS